MSADLAHNDAEGDDGSLARLVADVYARFLTADGTRRSVADQVQRVSRRVYAASKPNGHDN